MSFFLEAEIELADEFLLDATAYIATHSLTAARESLLNAEAALQIVERYIRPLRSCEAAASYATLIRDRREQALVMEQWIQIPLLRMKDAKYPGCPAEV